MKIKITDESLQVGHIKFYDYDEPSCCESNYADWSALKDTTIEQVIEMKYSSKELTLKNVLGYIETCEYGFKIFGFFVPCYYSGNGYYTWHTNLVAKDMITGKTVEYHIDTNEEGEEI